MARIKNIEKLTFKDFIVDLDLYFGLTEGLTQLPCPHEININGVLYSVPAIDTFTDNICYGQRLYMARQEDNDIELIARMIGGYYYPLITNQKWSEDNLLLIAKNVLTCKIKDLYPITMHFVELIGQIIDKEKKLLYREPSKVEMAAGIEKLSVFSELNALDFLRDAMKCTVPEVLLTPYNECLVRFLNAKELSDYQERYFELLKEKADAELKFKKR